MNQILLKAVISINAPWKPPDSFGKICNFILQNTGGADLPRPQSVSLFVLSYYFGVWMG